MIYVECNADQTLVETLVQSKKLISHSFGKGNVCNRLKKNTNSIGLVDEDPSCAQPGYIKKLEWISEKNGLKIYKDKNSNNTLIMLCPRLEEWILKASEEAKKDVSDYGLPKDANSLHKRLSIRKDRQKFRSLIDVVRQKSQLIQSLGEHL